MTVWCDPVQVRQVRPQKYFHNIRRNIKGDMYLVADEVGIPVELLQMVAVGGFDVHFVGSISDAIEQSREWDRKHAT